MRWLWIPAVTALFFVGDRLGAYAFSKFVAESEFRYSRMYSGRAEADILLIGNSRGLTYYQPAIEEIAGQKTFNLSYNGLPVELASILAGDYLDRYGAPEVLLVDVTLIDRENPSLIQDFRTYAPYSDGLDDLLRDSFPNIWGGTKLTHLSRYGGEVAQRMLYYTGRSDETWLLDRVMSEELADAAEDFEAHTNGYTPARIETLAAFVERFEAAGTAVYLTVNPYLPAYARTIENLDALVADVEGATGLEVHNYATAIQERELFGDYQHLNKAGAEVFLRQMLTDLGLAK